MSRGITALDRAQEVLDQDVRPLIQAHGGDVKITEFQDGKLNVEFVAACAACELRPVTFAATVRRRLLDVEGVAEVECATVPLRPARLNAIANFFEEPAQA